MGADASNVDFFVEILGVDPYTFTSSAVTGSLTNWGTLVQSIDSTTTNVTDLPTPTNSAPGITTVTVTKKFVNTMDVGMLVFNCTLKSIESWNKTGRALITFPTYYNPNLGEGISC